MAGTPSTLLGQVNQILLPPTIVGPIFKKAAEESTVMRLARKVPLAMNAQTAIPIPLDVPTADWVGEGGLKPVGSEGIGVKTMTGKKLALVMPVSEELVRTNPAGLYDQLQSDLPTALSRGFDYAAIHGASLRNPAAGPGSGPFTDYLVQTPNTQTIGSATQAQGGVYDDLWSGISKVINSPTQPYDFTAFAADKRLIPEVARSYDTQGRPIFSANGYVGGDAPGLVTTNTGSLVTYPVAFGTGISGRYYRAGNGVQTVTVTGAPTGGTFTLTLGGQTSAPLPFNATAAQVQTALQALVGGFLGAPASNPFLITVAGTGPYTVTFGGPAQYITGNGKNLTGGTNPTVTSTQTTNLDSGLRAIGGDWSQCAWGQGMDITLKVSTEAAYVDSLGVMHSAFQENMVLLLIESYYGFVMADPNAFVQYVHTPGS